MSCDNACAGCGNCMVGMCQKCLQCSRCCQCFRRNTERYAAHTHEAVGVVRDLCKTPNTDWLANLKLAETSGGVGGGEGGEA